MWASVCVCVCVFNDVRMVWHVCSSILSFDTTPEPFSIAFQISP
jgi:hypothetical protein